MTYYLSIDEIPLYNYRKCSEEGLFIYSRRKIETENKKEIRKWVAIFVHSWSFIKYKIMRLFYSQIQINKLASDENDIQAFELIYDTCLKEFGIGEDQEVVFDLEMRIAELHCEFSISGDMFIQNKIKVLENELNEFLNRPNEADTDTAITYLSKWMGKIINQKEISYKEFRYLLRDFQRETQEMKAKQGALK